MTLSTGWQRFLFLGVMVLLLVTLPACACLEQFIDELLTELERALMEWWNNLITDLQGQISDWWNGLIEEVRRQFTDWWEGLKQGWQDFWTQFNPPAPVIMAPADGTVSPGAAVEVRGTSLAGYTVTLHRDGRYYRETPVEANGEWHMAGVMLNKGDNIFTANASKIRFQDVGLINSPASNSIRVTFPGGEVGPVPVMSPAVDSTLEPSVWLMELALELLKADGQNFYESRRGAFTAALQAGLQASQEDDEAHRFINPDMPLTFDEYLLVFLVPKDAPTSKILEAFSKAVESAVLDKAVRRELMVQIQESFKHMGETWVLEEGSVSNTFEYVRIELNRTYLLEHFDPRALARFRARLGTELITGLLSEVSGGVVEEAVKMGFALWGRADADSQAQHYYDLALRAWNHRDIAGTPLPWDDSTNNAFDGDMGYSFDTNEEWAMFYLGRAAFYLQSVADPYYTIPYYKAEADLYAFMARQATIELTKKLIAKKVEAHFGKVVGGAQPITQIFLTKEILDWMVAFLRYADAREVRDVHRPNFAEFTAGRQFDYPMPAERQQAGATNDRAGYPFRSPNDLLLHAYLSNHPFAIADRTLNPERTFEVQSLLTSRKQALGIEISWPRQDLRQITRDIGRRATQYVHPGRIGQTDKRIPEGDMIVANPYLLREVYSLAPLSQPPQSPWWQVEVGEQLRLVLLDGTVIEGRVDSRPQVQPVDYDYHNSQTIIENKVWVYLIILNELSYIAGSFGDFPYRELTLVAIEGDSKRLYAVLDRFTGSPTNISPGSWPDLMYYLAGITGNPGSSGDLPEKDGAADIAADRLAMGALATRYLLGRFANDATAYRPPEPIVVGPGEVGVAFGSPGTVHLYDRQGRHVGPTVAGDVEIQIPGARYFTNPETGQQFIVVTQSDLAQDYKVQVDGSGNGAFDLDVFYTDDKRSQAVRLIYDDVPLNSATTAELPVQAGNSHLLHLDEDGNGKFDRELSPSQTIEVAVFEFGRASSWPAPVIISVALVIVGVGGTWLIIRRWRPWPPHQQQRKPVPAAQPTVLPICTRCGMVAQRPEAQFCQRCGQPFTTASSALSPCPRCGSIARRAGARFCPRCGSPV